MKNESEKWFGYRERDGWRSNDRIVAKHRLVSGRAHSRVTIHSGYPEVPRQRIVTSAVGKMAHAVWT